MSEARLPDSIRRPLGKLPACVSPIGFGGYRVDDRSARHREALRLARRKERVIPPRDTARRVVRMALERGNLADLVFDDRALASHRILATLLGAILRLPPVERALAREQVKSVYLEKVFEAWERRSAHRA